MFQGVPSCSGNPYLLPLKTEGDKSDIALTLTSYLVGYSGWEHTEICHKSWESSEAKNIKQRFIRF